MDIELEAWPDPSPHGSYPADWDGQILIVYVDDGRTALHFPDPIRATVTTDSHTIRLVLRIDEDRLRPVVDEMHVYRRPSGAPVNADTLRSLGLQDALREIAERTGVRWVSDDGRSWHLDRTQANEYSGRVDAHEAALAFRPRRRPGSPDEVQRAAAVYRDALANGHRNATERVAEALHVSRSTAARRITKARQAGLLGVPLGTRAGEGRTP